MGKIGLAGGSSRPSASQTLSHHQ